MPSVSRIATLVATTSLAVSAIAGCGASGGSGTGVDVVAQVGHSSITRATLSHWMGSMAGGDYYESLGRKAPKGLASDPPSYATCLSAIEAIGPPKAGSARTSQDRAELESKCRQLYTALKKQALSYLISVLWAVEEGAEHGFKVTEAEVKQKFLRLKAVQFPHEGEFTTYLQERGWVLSDELYQLKRNLLEDKLLPLLEQSLSGGQQAFVKRATENATRMTAETSCRAGYVIPDCKQYTGSSTSIAAPDLLLEKLAASR